MVDGGKDFKFGKLAHLGVCIKVMPLVSYSVGTGQGGGRKGQSAQDFPPFPVHILPRRAQHRWVAVPQEGEARR